MLVVLLLYFNVGLSTIISTIRWKKVSRVSCWRESKTIERDDYNFKTNTFFPILYICIYIYVYVYLSLCFYPHFVLTGNRWCSYKRMSMHLNTCTDLKNAQKFNLKLLIGLKWIEMDWNGRGATKLIFRVKYILFFFLLTIVCVFVSVFFSLFVITRPRYFLPLSSDIFSRNWQ